MIDNDSEKIMEKIIDEITSYVSNEVNWVEACAIYMEKNNVDAETFATVVQNSPVLLSRVTESARLTKAVSFDYAALPL